MVTEHRANCNTQKRPKINRIRVAILRWGEPIGGVEPVLRDIALHIDKSKFEVHFIFMACSGPYSQEMKLAGCAVSVIPARGGFDILTRIRLCAALLKFKPQVVQDHGMPPFIRPLVKLTTGVPLLTFDHGVIDINRKRNNKWKNVIYGLELRLLCDGIAFNSMVNMKDVTETFDLTKKRTSIVHLGLDLVRFGKSAREGAATFTGMVLGFVGRVHHADKGTDYLPSIALSLIKKGFSNFAIYVIGDGPDLSCLKNQVHDLDLDGHFTFYGNRPDVPILLQKIDIILVPSRAEAFGLSPLEGLASGCRVVAFRVGALTEVLSECKDAYLVNAGDVDAMVQKTIELWKNYRKNRAMYAFDFVKEKYEVTRMVRNIEDLFLKALDKNNQAAHQ